MWLQKTTPLLPSVITGTSYVNGTNDQPVTINLNVDETYVMATHVNNAAKRWSDWALIESNKNIAVNCESVNGSSSAVSSRLRNFGIDQIAPVEKIGTKYIFTRGYGTDDMENAIIVAHEQH